MADAMKLVPVEPTQAMIEAMDQAVFTHGNVIDAYRAMLAASPPARKEAPADPCAPHKAEGFSLDPCCPQCEAPVEGARDWQATIDRIVPVIAPMDAIEASEFCCEHTLLLDRTRIRRELAALRNRTSEPEAGAVAWRAEKEKQTYLYDTDEEYRMHSARSLGFRITPLFTRPAPATADKLREVAALLNDCICLDTDTGDYRVEHDGSVEKARAILAALNEQPK